MADLGDVEYADEQNFNRRAALWACCVVLVGSVILLFTHLGIYALWDDESLTAMTARNVWRTGDTSALVDGHNLLAYRNGLLLKRFSDRYSPPLQFYFLSPWIGLLGKSTFVCRLPFAFCGLLTIGIILRWMWRARSPAWVWWAMVAIVLTDDSFFLFNRQCRYYALASLFSAAVVYAYFKWNVCSESIWPLLLALLALLVSHYLNYAATVGCLLIDYAIWGRKRRKLSWKDWAILLLPQIVLAGIVFSIWNPAARSATVAAAGRSSTLGAAEYASTAVPFVSAAWWKDYLKLFLFNWRDMFASDFLILPLTMICPFLFLIKKSSWLLRAPVALIVFLIITVLMTTHPISWHEDAEMRYLAPVLPLGIGIAVLAVWALGSLKLTARILVLVIATISVLIAPSADGRRFVSAGSSLLFYHELWQPQQEPYTPTAKWINLNVPARASVYVLPGYMTYPLMFHAPEPIYAWQLLDPPRAEYLKLSPQLIYGRIAPDYLIAFGPYTKVMDRVRQELSHRGTEYELVATIHTYWGDKFRPEKIWRSFVTVQPGSGDEIYIYQQRKPPLNR